MLARLKRFGAICALGALAGCSAGRTLVPREDLADPPGSDSYFVTTVDGRELEFVTFRADGEAVRGTIRTVEQKLVGQGEDERMVSRNLYRELTLPLTEVTRVEVPRRGPSPILVGLAGAAVIGGAFLVFRGDNGDEGGGGGGGKEPPPLP